MSRWVQVRHDELLEYVAMVEYLRKDHTALQEQVKDAKELASIIEATYKERLDKLTDLILDIHPANHKYERGLMDAYNILAGMSRAHSQGTTTQWRNLRAACFRVWGRSCLMCGDRATDVDHIIELAAGGTNTIDNVQPLCKPCHIAKTSRFNATRATEPQQSRFFWSSATHRLPWYYFSPIGPI
jgi:hypothetical protein